MNRFQRGRSCVRRSLKIESVVEEALIRPSATFSHLRREKAKASNTIALSRARRGEGARQGG